MRQFCFTIACIALAACSNANSPARPANPAAMPPWPGYVAIDYGKPGQPKLGAADRSHIGNILDTVLPCQRPLVRYAFAGGSGSMVLFFEIPPDRGAHVFGQSGLIYVPSSDSVVAAPPDSMDVAEIRKLGVQWDVEHQSCAPDGASLFTVSAGGDETPGLLRVAVHPGATIRNVAAECLGFAGEPPQIGARSLVVMKERFSREGVEPPVPAVSGGESYTKPLQSCPILGASRAGARYVDHYLVVLAFSPPGDAERYASIALDWSGSHNGVETWLSAIPSTRLRDCCEPQLKSLLQSDASHDRR